MASVFRRKDSKYWTACYTSRDGRQLKRSTKTTNKSQALQIALEYERVESQARKNSLTTAQLQRVLSDVSERITGDSLEAPSVEQYLKEWLESIRTRVSANTLTRYDNTAKVFLRSLGPRAKQPITSITPKHIEEFINDRMRAGMAPKTVILDLKSLNTAFRRAENYSIIIKNPIAAVRPPKDQSSERDVFSHDEVEKLLNAAPTLEWQTLILLGYFVGARLKDCIHMKWEHIRPDDGVIVYEQAKTGRKVTVPMHYHVIDHLKYLSNFGTDGYLCPSLAKKGPGGKHGLSEGFKRIVRKAGLDLMVVQGKGTRKFARRTFHSLRHSFSSALANAGVPEELRMKLAGHSTRSIHTRYTHMELEALKNAMDAFPAFDSKGKPELTSD